MVYNDYGTMGREGDIPIYEDTHPNDENYSQRLRSYQNSMQYASQQAVSQPVQPSYATKEVKSLKNLMVYAPKTEMDSVTVIDFLKRKEPAIINLSSADPEVAQRVLDFSSGAVYALSGTVHKIEENIFLLLPAGIEITNFDGGNDD